MRAPFFKSLDPKVQILSPSIPVMAEDYTLELQKMGKSNLTLPVRNGNVIIFLFSENSFIERQSKTKNQQGRFNKGECGIYPPGCGEDIFWHNEVEALNIHIHNRTIGTYAQNIFGYKNITLQRHFRLQDNKLAKLAFGLREAIALPSYLRRKTTDPIMREMIEYLLTNYSQKPSKNIQSQIERRKQFDPALKYVADNIEKTLTIEDMAYNMNLSKFHFSRLFKTTFGMSPYQYIMNQKVVRAKTLLSYPESTLAEISYICGFNDQSHFTRIFKDFTRQTPQAFKEMQTQLIS